MKELPDIEEIIIDWYDWVRKKDDYLFADDKPSEKEFLDLVEDTYTIIKDVHCTYIKNNTLPPYIEQYFSLISIISRYGYFDDIMTGIDNRLYIVTCIIAKGLTELAVHNRGIIGEKEGTMFFCGLDFRSEGVLVSHKELMKDYFYNVHDKDISEFKELVYLLEKWLF